MNDAIYFKWLQRKNRFRNPEHQTDRPHDFFLSKTETLEIQKYLDQLQLKNISYTYPSGIYYPKAFLEMKEPPLFIEYIGTPIWDQTELFSIVGSRKLHALTQSWIQSEFLDFLNETKLTVVSGGARGVDQAAHLAALKAQRPTIVVLPSGLNQMYPSDLSELYEEVLFHKGVFISEFEMNQKVHKSFFYLRNRLIAALGKCCLVAQAGQKSGTMLTVHHALEFGKPILTLPSHPMMLDFSGNVQLAKDGAVLVYEKQDLLDFWQAESWSGPVRVKTASTGGGQFEQLAL